MGVQIVVICTNTLNITLRHISYLLFLQLYVLFTKENVTVASNFHADITTHHSVEYL